MNDPELLLMKWIELRGEKRNGPYPGQALSSPDS
jgi:hypothetical protein